MSEARVYGKDETTGDVDLRPVTRAELSALSKRVQELERVVHKEHRPELDEHDDRLDAHDKAFEAHRASMQAIFSGLTDRVTAELLEQKGQLQALTRVSNEQNQTFKELNATLMRIILAKESGGV